jgi:hypothetical protein
MFLQTWFLQSGVETFYVGESNCKENGGISLPTRVERWSPSKCCRLEVVVL